MTSDLAIELVDLHAWYGQAEVLHGIDLRVHRGEIVALLGRNGSGRSSTMRSIMGLLSRISGNIRINGIETIGLAPHRIARLGVGYCPEERGVFSGLSCGENLTLLPRIGPHDMPLARIYEMFPNLGNRSRSGGSKLSGGEQQMLAVARILLAGADILLLDEITEGLAPIIVEHLVEVLSRLHKSGFTMLLSGQNLEFAADLADRHYVIESGSIVGEVARSELGQSADFLNSFLGL